MADSTIANVGDLAKPATVFIEKVSEAIGGLAKPWQIKRVADATARAAIITAQADLEIHDIQRRAIVRMINEESKQQEIIEKIIEITIPKLTDSKSIALMNDDWIESFFQKCRHISDVEIQELWSKILTQEATNPGMFSKNTLEILSKFDKRDAENFKKLSNFFVMIDPENRYKQSTQKVPAIIFREFQNDYLEKFDLVHDDLINLESLSIIKSSFESFSMYCLDYSEDLDQCEIEYGDKKIKISLKNGKILVGDILFTKWGQELAQIFEWERSDEHFLVLEELLISMNS